MPVILPLPELLLALFTLAGVPYVVYLPDRASSPPRTRPLCLHAASLLAFAAAGLNPDTLAAVSVFIRATETLNAQRCVSPALPPSRPSCSRPHARAAHTRTHGEYDNKTRRRRRPSRAIFFLSLALPLGRGLHVGPPRNTVAPPQYLPASSATRRDRRVSETQELCSLNI